MKTLLANTKLFLSYYRPYKRMLLADLVCAFIVSAIALILPLCARHITHTILADNAPDALQQIAIMCVMGVSRLSITEVSNMLSQLLQRNDVQTLARIVKSKTRGNFFVVLQFLRLLEKLRFLYFENAAWHFDTTAISSVQLISEDVQQLVAQNLETLATDRKAALMVAASFGVSKFEVSTIVHAIRALADESKHGDDSDILFEDPHIVREKVNTMSVELTKAAGDGFVEETTTPGQFRFSHDRIRESAYSLLPKGESRKGVHLRVGRQLRSWMDTQSELGISQGFSRESLLLHATKQLNAGSDLIDDMWEVLDLAELNYQSAELAASKTAFFSSMEYLHIGLAHLGDDGWKEHYALALKFSVALARIQYSCNMLQECWQTTSSVIENGKTFRDKEQALHTQILVHMQNENLGEALKLALSVCDQMGHPFPRRFKIGTIMMQFFQVRKAFRALSDQELLDLPALAVKDVDMHIDFLEHLGEISMLDNQFVYIFLYTMRTLLIVLKQGHYARSFNTLMAWAFIKVQFGEFGEGKRYAQLASQLCERQRLKLPGACARFDMGNAAYLDHWQRPLRDSLGEMKQSFTVLWQSGLVETALMDVYVLFRHLFFVGEPLDIVRQEMEKYAEYFKDYKKDWHWQINSSMHQAVLNLQYECGNAAVLKGQHLNPDTCEPIWKSTGNKMAMFQFHFWSMLVAYHFNDMHRAKRSIKAMRSDIFEDGPEILVPMRVFYTGLVYIALCRDYRKRKYRIRAQSAIKQLRQWANAGAVNCIYMCDILHAEMTSIVSFRTNVVVLEAYDKAIDSVTSARFVLHMALAHELAGEFCTRRNNFASARAYLKKARDRYHEWGATNKAQDVQSRRQRLLEKVSSADDAATTLALGKVEHTDCVYNELSMTSLPQSR